jgi:hypothetical protein
VPAPSRIVIARCRQTFASARSSPSAPRTTATGSPATSTATYEPGSATCEAWHAKTQERAKTSRRSRS